MQSIKIICIGKLKNSSLKSEIEELKKRVKRLEIVELKDVKDDNSEIVKKKEFELIKSYIELSCDNYLLWEFGEEYLTKEFCDLIIKSEKSIQFIITGAFGPSDELKDLIRKHISLSKMTFTHEQALYMLVEQIYRAQCHGKGVNYTK